MNRPAALSFTLYLIAVAGLILLASLAPVHAQEKTCRTVADNLREATQLNVTADKITTVYDVEFISEFLKETRLGIPDGSAPKGIMLIEFGPKVYVGLIEQDGCILYQAAIDYGLYAMALKAATSGV